MSQRVLSHGLLLALSLSAPGCIIPTPLQGEPAPNQAPVIVGSTPAFAAGPLVCHAQDDLVLTVLAMDPDADEPLVAGLYYRQDRGGAPPLALELARAQLAFPGGPIASSGPGGPGGIDGEGGTAVLTAPRICERLAAQPERDKLLHVYVTDRPLPAAFNPFVHTRPDDAWIQHSAHAQWILNCL
ncbi:MAG TPA: hypothetical protein VH877_12090 [Polyangia bacterium]|jgi:hypothetical protein|nr:hypothetical protein [Polyangia bacterium]